MCHRSAIVVNWFPLRFWFGYSLLFGIEAVIIEADAPADDHAQFMLR
jgi:hypothetical protein